MHLDMYVHWQKLHESLKGRLVLSQQPSQPMCLHYIWTQHSVQHFYDSLISMLNFFTVCAPRLQCRLCHPNWTLFIYPCYSCSNLFDVLHIAYFPHCCRYMSEVYIAAITSSRRPTSSWHHTNCCTLVG